LKMAEFPTFKGSWPWPWHWIGSYCIPSCVTHRPLPTYSTEFRVTSQIVATFAPDDRRWQTPESKTILAPHTICRRASNKMHIDY